jgi:hypothetical protein
MKRKALALTAALLLSACSTATHYCAEPYLSCHDRDGGKQIDHEPVRAYPHGTKTEERKWP